MTVCVAAITREKYIVTASDTMISHFLSSSDECTVKLEHIGKDWAAMISGDDITQCLPIIERARENASNCDNTLKAMRSSFKRAYHLHVAERAGDKVLSRFQVSMKDFRERGTSIFTERVYDQLAAEIRQIKGDSTFLIYGFDRNGNPHIFIVDDPGTDEIYDDPGFCAIGAGKYAAEGTLYHLKQNKDADFYQSIFNVCAAKFSAERVPGVGKDTFLFVKKQGSSAFRRPSWLLPTIRARWEKDGQQRVPEGIIQQICRADMAFY